MLDRLLGGVSEQTLRTGEPASCGPDRTSVGEAPSDPARAVRRTSRLASLEIPVMCALEAASASSSRPSMRAVVAYSSRSRPRAASSHQPRERLVGLEPRSLLGGGAGAFRSAMPGIVSPRVPGAQLGAIIRPKATTTDQPRLPRHRHPSLARAGRRLEEVGVSQTCSAWKSPRGRSRRWVSSKWCKVRLRSTWGVWRPSTSAVSASRSPMWGSVPRVRRHVYAPPMLASPRAGFEDGVVTCPCHGSRFDVTSGEVLRGTARVRRRSYAVLVEGDALRVKI